MFLFSYLFIAQIISASGSDSGPRINPPDEYHIATNGKDPNPSINMTCDGNEELHWNSPHLQLAEITTVDSVEGYSFRSTFYMKGPLYIQDSGYYTCSYKNSSNNASTYIYVSYTDQYDTIFVDYDELIPLIPVSIKPGKDFPLSCRISRPTATIDLYHNDVLLDYSAYVMDPRTGVTIKAGDSTPGIYKCRNSANELDVMNFNVKYEEILRLPDKPHINSYYNENYLVGQNFELNCSVPSYSTKGTKLIWGQTSLKQETTKAKEIKLAEMKKRITTLTIKSPTIDDSGRYTCIHYNREYTQRTEVNITFKEDLEPFVRFKGKETKILIHVTNRTLEWRLRLRAYPRDVIYKFYNPRNEVIRETINTSIDFDYMNGQLTLGIDPVTPEHFGLYIVEARTPDNKLNDRRYARVIVIDEPKVRIEKKLAQQVFSVGEEVEILSKILSSTKPDVKWTINTCIDGTKLCDKTIMSNVSSNATDPGNKWFSRAYLTANQSGLLNCLASNTEGDSQRSKKIFVSDFGKKYSFKIISEDGHIEHSDYPINVTEGDNVTIQCSGLKYIYENISLISNDFTSKSYNCGTNLTHAQCIGVPNVEKSYNSNYTCTSVKNSKNKKTIEEFIEVISFESNPPTLKPSSNVSFEGKEVSVNIGERLVLSCQIDGRPTPSLTWYKDYEKLTFDQNEVYTLNNGQYLKILSTLPKHSGIYECIAENRIKTIRPFINITVHGQTLPLWGWIFIVISIIILIFLLVISMHQHLKYMKARRDKMELRRNRCYLFEHGNVVDLSPECTTDEQAELLPYDKSYEVDKDKIKLGKMLGYGAFGQVKLAKVDDLEEDGKRSLAAVKMCKDSSDTSQLRSLTVELKIMIHIGKHLNIVNLLGACTSNIVNGELWILVEYCKHGNLLKFIRRYKEGFIDQIDSETNLIDFRKGILIDEYNEHTGTSELERTSRRYTENSLKFYKSLSLSSKQTPKRRLISLSDDRSTKASSNRSYVGNPEYDLIPHPRKISGDSIAKDTRTSATPEYYNYNRTASISMKEKTSADYTNDVNKSDYLTATSAPLSPTSLDGRESFFSTTLPPEDNIPGISVPFTTSTLLSWAWQVACAMQYLSDRKVLHADLAARNLLLAQHNIVKISDFGLSRDMYKKDIYCKKSDDLMPIKWMSLEAIKERLFSTQSDVWAYGVTLWEMFTLGNSPYPGIPVDNEFVLRLENGMRLSQPKYSNTQIYNIMMECWKNEPNQRPLFSQIAKKFEDLHQPEMCEDYIAMNKLCQLKNSDYFQSNTDYLPMMCSPDITALQNANTNIAAENSLDLEEAKSFNEVGYLHMRPISGPCQSPAEIFSPRVEDSNDQNQFFPNEANHLDLKQLKPSNDYVKG